jgi:hypothetical protein
MTYEEIFQFVDAEPFRPFRIQMASGRTFDVRHPEMIRVGLNEVVVFQFSKQDGRVHEKFKMLGLNLIGSIELLDASVNQNQS